MVNNISLSVIAWVSALRGTIVEMIHDDERGQDLMEYIILAGFIGLAGAVAFFTAQQAGILDPQGMANAIGDCISFGPNCGAP